MVSHGRELMESGNLEQACEVLRKALSIETGNVTAKTLFERVNALLGTNARKLVGKIRITEDQNRILAAVPPAENLASRQSSGGTVAATSPLDFSLLRVLEQSSNPGVSSDSAAGNRGGEDGGTVFASSPTKAHRNERPAPRASGQRSEAQKTAAPRSVPPPSPARNSSQTAARLRTSSRRNRTLLFTTTAVVVLLMLGAAGYKKLTQQHAVDNEPHFHVSPPAAPITEPAPSAASSDVAPAAEVPAAPRVSIEDQQRRLIDEAHQAVAAKDYKTARTLLEEAAKLKGPLNSLIADLKREFSDEAHEAEARLAAQQEQALWTRAMKDFDAGRLDDSEKPLREILLLPEAGQHWTDAAKYVDEIIPKRRSEEQLWARAEQEAGLTGAGHRINEVKILDQVLATGGVHQQEARQRRDSLFSQFAREIHRKNNSQDSAVSASDQAQFPRLQNAVDDAVAQGDAKALEQLQEIRPRFKSIAEGGGPLVPDARDYLNNVVPRAQRAIEAKLANAEAETLSNEKFRDAVKGFDQAVRTQDAKILRTQIQSEFQVIANSAGPRTVEAERYINTLIPAALKKIAR
jgi:hypothetical protein